MLKSKNALKKFISFALAAVILVCSLFTISAGATDTIELDGKVHTVEFTSWQSPGMNIESRATDLTSEEIAELEEALLTADYDDYDIITGIDYEIKRVPLKYGYSIEFISICQNDNDSLAKNKDSSVMRSNEYKTGTARVSIKDTNGQEVGYVTITATFWWETSTVTFTSANMSSSNPPSASWSNVTYSAYGSGGSVCGVMSFPTLNIGGTQIRYQLTVECDNTGYVRIING